jgi:sec-independent protein translocase protein TatB
MDLSWSELLVVGIVALIVIGPKDLPGMFRELGRFTAKVRSMGREFSRAMEQAAKETGVKDVADDLRKVTNPKSMGLDAVRSAADKFEKWDPLKPATAGCCGRGGPGCRRPGDCGAEGKGCGGQGRIGREGRGDAGGAGPGTGRCRRGAGGQAARAGAQEGRAGHG